MDPSQFNRQTGRAAENCQLNSGKKKKINKQKIASELEKLKTTFPRIDEDTLFKNLEINDYDYDSTIKFIQE